MSKLVGTYEAAAHDLFIIDEVAAAWWASQGHTVIQTPTGKAVVGKDIFGKDVEGALTTTWDVPQPVNFTVKNGEVIPDEGTEWYITDPAEDARFKDWRDYIPEGVTLKTRAEE